MLVGFALASWSTMSVLYIPSNYACLLDYLVFILVVAFLKAPNIHGDMMSRV